MPLSDRANRLSPAPEAAPRTDREAAWKPFGKGYRRFPEIFLHYSGPPGMPRRNPDLACGLSTMRTAAAKRIIRGAGPRPRCLLQGITSAHNAAALGRYLSDLGVADPSIHAVDIIDVDQVGRAAGLPLEGVQFHVGDAASLAEWDDRSVQILVQDHLLNCCPHASHRAVLREAARMLDPNGVLLLNVSVDPPGSGAAISRETAERILGARWRSEAYCLAEMAGESRLAEVEPLLLGRVVQEAGDRQVLVTRPHGNLEFYSTFGALARLVEEAGLRFVLVRSARAEDGETAGCLRYHTLVRHAEAG